jgi:hypothetical protein
LISLLLKILEVDFIFPSVVVPLATLALYCGCFLFVSRFLPKGVNYFFVLKFFECDLVVLAGIYLSFFVAFSIKRKKEFFFKNPIKRFVPSDYLLLLLPLTPVVQYIINNQNITSPLESLLVFLFFLLLFVVFIFAIPALLSMIGSTQILTILSLAFVFSIASMASISHYFSWYKSGVFIIQLAIFAGVFMITFLLHRTKRNILYLCVVFVFLVNSAIQLFSYKAEASTASLPISENKLLSIVDGRKASSTPNIYLLAYDAYVPNETLLAYGIDNASQEEFLHSQGFNLYPHTYSVGALTVNSMSRVFNASIDYYGNIRRGVSGDGVVQNLLHIMGYKTYGIFPSDFVFRGIGSSYDFSYPQPKQQIILANAILVGEFRFEFTYQKMPRNKYVEQKQTIFKNPPQYPFLIYTHSDLPSHSQQSGTCRSDESALYEAKLVNANNEMRQDVNLIIANDPHAIIIVAGDHGPYLTKNCMSTTGYYDISEISRLDIQDRFGTFLAIRWPSKDFTKYDQITVLQDLFPAIFAYLFEDPRILESKIDPVIIDNAISGVTVKNGIIFGGMDDGGMLFLSNK